MHATAAANRAQQHRGSGPRTSAIVAFISAFLLGAGCTSPTPTQLTKEEVTPYGSMILAEGDVVVITFPGQTANLDTTQPIRRDGKISLPLVGEVEAAGKTPSELEKELKELYKPQLVVSEVSVSILSSAFPVYISGAVGRPGKIMTDRPITALEAVMEAGGFVLGRANLKSVVVIRQQPTGLKHYFLDLKAVLEGRSSQRFYVRPSDIVYVPEKAF